MPESNRSIRRASYKLGHIGFTLLCYSIFFLETNW